MAGIAKDITELKRAEEALRESEEKYRSIVETTSEWIWEIDLKGMHTFSNPGVTAILGYRPDEFVGQTAISLMQEEDRSKVETALVRLIAEKRGWRDWILRWRHKDGSYRFLESNADPIIDSNGQIRGFRGSDRDITERKKIEDALIDSENRYRNHFESSSEFYFTLDLKGNFIDVNKAAEVLTGYPKSELLKMNFKDYTPKSEHRNLFLTLANIYKTGKPVQNFLVEATIKNNSKKYFETSFSLMKKGEQIIGFQGSSKDITERKLAEEQIRASLQEKEVLLKEIHHRVKNNLQVISGLLTLQAGQINDERLQGLLKESQSRIWTMALIHQTLYQSGNLAAIDMADYIRTLSGNLLSSQARVAMPPTVNFDLAPLLLAIEKAIPLALIINELLTNCLKHAFADGRPGEIRISLQERRQGVKFTTQWENQ